MEETKPFLVFLNKFADFSADEFQTLLAPYISIRHFNKKEFFSKPGEVDNYFNFLLKGLVRKYYKKGKEQINTQISFENHVILSEESFYSRQPSEYFIEAIEPTIALSITYEDLEKAYGQSHKLEHLGRLIIIQTFLLKDKWQLQMIKMTSRERFINFVNKNPELLQRVPQKFLASYLNIKPETFSRFKHLLRTPKLPESIQAPHQGSS
ncbi:MAG: Crp/Fnr family transcriptional regulator [Chitinophagaceae bacterium]|nr:Crp/Fnr family transcriptional regulator [Chitinophagaceae bacterium]